MKNMKRAISILLILIMALAAISPAAYADSDTTTFIVPHGATLEVNLKPTNSSNGQLIHYIPFETITPNGISSGEEYDTYIYQIDSATMDNYHYRVSQDGYLTKADWLSKSDTGTTINISLDKLTNKRIDYATDSYDDNDYYDDGLLMNIGSSSCLDLEPDETFQIKTYRAWQIVNNTSANYFIEPDWHFELIQGDSATVSDTGLVTAVSDGMSIIRVTYDPIEAGGQYYNGIDPVHTGIVIVNVKTDENKTFSTGIYTTEFDTIYYADILNGESLGNSYAEYTFTPDDGATISVLEAPATSGAISGTWTTGWTDYTPDGNGTYTVDLKPGRNIVRLEKDGVAEYHVIRAAGLGINIENKTYPGEVLTQGSTARITFDGLFMPLPKLAAVYNPGYNYTGESTVKVQYELDGATVKGKGTQYSLRTTNQLDIPLDEIGTYTLTGGTVHLTYYGGSVTHYTIPDSGLTPNFGAGEIGPFYYSQLPDITFTAVDGDVLAEQARLIYSRLSGLQTNITYENIFNADQLKATSFSEDQITPNNTVYRYNKTDDEGCLALTFSPVNSETSMLWRYWRGDDSSSAIVEKITDTPYSFEAEGMPLLISWKKSDMVNAELIVMPDDEDAGYPKTYTFKAFRSRIQYSNSASTHSPYITNNFPFLYDVTLTPLTGEGEFNVTDGLFHAKDVTYMEDGNEKTIDFGYGFLTTEAEHTVTVPYSTDRIRLDLELARLLNTGTYPTSGVTAKISVDGTELETLTGNTDDSTNIISTSAILLNEGNTTVTIELTRIKEDPDTDINEDLSMTYVIDVVRRGAPKTVTFASETAGTDIMVKNSKSQTMTANDDGTYSLEAGEYTYISTKDGYISLKSSFTVGDDDKTITIPALTVSPTVGDDDSVTVLVRSDTGTVRSSVAVSITDDPDALDLVTGKKYVEYNAGAYTALHAVINALNTGLDPVDFSCYKGYLKPSVEIDDTDYGSDCGWVCEVNGVYVAEPAYYLLKDGDSVVYYYNKDYDDMIHAWFEKEMFSITEGDSVTLGLSGVAVKDTSTAAGALSGASILVNNVVKGETNANGQCTITFDEAGTYAVTAQKLDASGNNLLTFNYCLVKVSSPDTTAVSGKTTVKFRLIGDALHEGSDHGTYVTWIATKKYTFEGDSVSVYDVFKTALDEAGLDYKGADSNYVSKIKAPEAYGGYWLSEFDNGKNSGWMYTVNGVHPQYGLKDYYVTSGDVIIWHYIDDYKTEEDLYTWLEAEDEDPPDDGTVIDMSEGNKKTSDSETTVSVPVSAKTDALGKAVASVSAKEITSALANALKAASEAKADGKKNVVAEVKLDVSADSSVKSVETTIPTSSVKAVAKADDTVLTIETPVGNLSFDETAISAISEEAAGSSIKITVGKADTSKLSETQRQAISDRPVYELNLTSGDQIISDFGGGKVSVSLPYTLAEGEQVENIRIFYVNGDGKLILVEGASYNEKTGLVTFTTDHFSYYVIGYQIADKFTDVKSGSWFYDNVMYLVNEGVIKGKGDNMFAPNDSITRAEFVQILYSMAQAEADSTGSAVTSNTVAAADSAKTETVFKDVKSSEWYGKAVTWAYENGVAAGVAGSDGTLSFAPNENISRQDMAVMIQNFTNKIEKKGIAVTVPAAAFTDGSDIAAYAKEAVSLMQQGGIINGINKKNASGDTVTVFSPKNCATRAEAATMIAKLLKQNDEKTQ